MNTHAFRRSWNVEPGAPDTDLETKKLIPDWLLPYGIWMDEICHDDQGCAGWNVSPATENSPWWDFNEASFIWSFTVHIAKRTDGKIAAYTQECDIAEDVFEDRLTPDTVPPEYVHDSIDAYLKTVMEVPAAEAA